MRTVSVDLESISAYSQSRNLVREFPKKPEEPWPEWEERVWKDKAHYSEEGNVFIPQFAFKQAIDNASKYLGKISGKGNATWTKHFVGGVVVSDSIVLPLKRDDLAHVWISASSTGKRGAGSRVDRCFPVVPKWSGSLKCIILAEEITKEAFTKAMELAGSLIGIGRFRPENGGVNGRFLVKSIKWS